MRILQICPRIPFPPTDGGAIAIFNVTKHLALRGHEIHIFAFGAHRDMTADELARFCQLSVVVHSTESHWLDAIKTLKSRMPYTITKYQNDQMTDKLSKAVKISRFDIVQVEHLHMAQYGLHLKDRYGLPVVLRSHNLETRMMQRLSKMGNNPAFRSYLNLQFRKMRKYEPETAAKFDRCIMITEKDEQELLSMCRQIKTTTIQAGIDIPEPLDSIHETPKSVLFLASLDWLPNVEGFFWFYDNVLPILLRHLPDISVSIVGKGKSPRLERIEHKNIDFIGFADTVAPYIQKAWVCIVPLFVGSGMRIKILEMFAHSKCVVSTSVGCEGIDVVDGKHLIIADEPETFAQSIIDAIESKGLRSSIGKEAHKLAQRYDWKRVGEAFEAVHNEVILEKKSSHE